MNGRLGGQSIVTSFSTYLKQLSALSFSRSAKSTYLVFGGNLIAQGLSFLVTVAVCRILGPQQYGRLMLVYTFLLFLVDLLDLGLEKSFVNHFSRYSVRDPSKAPILFNNLLFIKIGTGVILSLAFFGMAPWIAESLYHSFDLIIPLRLTAVGFLGAALVRFLLTYLQACQCFKAFIGLSIVHSLLRVLGLFVIWQANSLSVSNLISLYVVAYFVVLLLVARSIQPTRLVWEWDRKILKEILNFGKWVALSTGLVIVETRLDTFMLGHLSDQSQVGYFSAASALVYIIPIFIASASTVLFPKVSRMLTILELKNYLKKLFRFYPLVIPAVLVGLFFSRDIIYLVYGDKFLPAIPILQILTASYLLVSVMVPASLVLFSMGKAWAVATTNFLELTVHFAANIYFLPQYGALGAAYSNILVKVITCISTISFLYFLLQHKKMVDEDNKII